MLAGRMMDGGEDDKQPTEPITKTTPEEEAKLGDTGVTETRIGVS